jgi:hypothetical protein
MRRLLLIALLFASPIVACGQESSRVRLGFITGDARTMLVQDWNGTNRFQPERMYCVVQDSSLDWGAYRATYVLKLRRAHVVYADPMSILADCGGAPSIHTHVSYCQTTMWGVNLFSCSLTVPEAMQCEASEPDLTEYTRNGAPYNIVQCGPTQFVFYWPDEVATLLHTHQ